MNAVSQSSPTKLDRVIDQLRADTSAESQSSEGEGNPDHLKALYDLCVALETRFRQNSQIQDLEEAVDLGHHIESLATAIDHPYLTWFHHCMVESNPSHEQMYPGSGRINNWTNTSAPDRFGSAVSWADLARGAAQLTLAIRAYKLALLLSDRCTTVQFDMDFQRLFLSRKDALRLAAKAAACAIEAGDLKAAVEMLEQGRSRTWSVIRDGTYPLDHLVEVAPDLAHSFGEVCVTLELFSVPPSEHDPFAEVRPQQIRTALKKWQGTLDKIRQLDGFSDILRPKSFKSLQVAAADGPIILLNIDTESRSDAIILQNDGDPVLVPLSRDNLPKIVSQITKAIASLNGAVRSSKPWHNPESPLGTMTGCLRLLWTFICKPIVTRLLELGVPEQSRIWWYPPGMMAALPIHAAGPYVDGERNLPDIFVSSYTSSLLALVKARSDWGNSVRGVKLLAFGMSNALPKVTSELHNLSDIFGSRAVIRTNDEVTREQAIKDLNINQEQGACTHFACHGSLDIRKPFESSFVLHNSYLTLRDIVRSAGTLGTKHLAFLALCHSAAIGDVEDAPDEFISLATGVQVSGFRSVVGTLWTMADADGPDLAREFYDSLMQKGAYDFDPRDAALSLHLAVKGLRDRGVPLEAAAAAGILSWQASHLYYGISVCCLLLRSANMEQKATLTTKSQALETMAEMASVMFALISTLLILHVQ
ncbi:hypothetical protein EVG20_g9383 [Dentipellis fragilis]|uniref:CHAT domain-containing protein n=1 Tax=Dentipellis fragilis TaxID=205917 RepID=A0A4Y9XYN3_9AGAM|nr:hypothetical protein EVG20_g9383 [Dentipellis fragilis]